MQATPKTVRFSDDVIVRELPALPTPNIVTYEQLLLEATKLSSPPNANHLHNSLAILFRGAHVGYAPTPEVDTAAGDEVCDSSPTLAGAQHHAAGLGAGDCG